MTTPNPTGEKVYSIEPSGGEEYPWTVSNGSSLAFAFILKCDAEEACMVANSAVGRANALAANELTRLAAELERVKVVLSDLYDNQNGVPLYSYEAGWNDAMRRATSILYPEQKYEDAKYGE